MSNIFIIFRFNVQAGSPPQVFQVLPATQAQNLWLPISDDCVRLQPNDSASCGTGRGVFSFAQRPSPGFQHNESSTWETIGLYELGLERSLGFGGNGLIGFDRMQVGNVSLDHQPVTAYASPKLWIGQIGLLPTSLNFSDTINSPSLLGSMKAGGHIPSLSFGYQAGASYRNTKVPASLTFGGYDSSRSSSIPLTIPIGSDDSRTLTVGLQNIVVTNSLNGTLSLTGAESVLAPIDSSVAELWLPRSTCNKFEAAFGLQYHEASDRYALTDATRDKLRQLSPTLTFTIGTSTVSGNTTLLQYPYSAFDLQASFPIFANTTNYFPIRRAHNESQYRLGRAFLQEVYLSVDYEHGVFNISQANFTSLIPVPNLVTIPPSNSNFNETGKIHELKPTHSLGAGTIAGIVVGCLLATFSIAVAVYLYKRRLGWRGPSAEKSTVSTKEAPHPSEIELVDNEIREMHHQSTCGELMGCEIQELPSSRS